MTIKHLGRVLSAAILLTLLINLSAQAQLGQIIPRPKMFEVEAGDTARLTPQSMIFFLYEDAPQEENEQVGTPDNREQLKRLANILNDGIQKILGYRLQVVEIDKSEDGSLFDKNRCDILLYRSGEAWQKEYPSSYMLLTGRIGSVGQSVAEKGVEIAGADAEGIFYGIQSFLQLLTPSGHLPKSLVADYASLSYRGVHLDVSRHFFDKAYILHLLDLMARYKLNVFHWHLVDGGGWRFPSDHYPLLTRLAAYRTEENWDKWWSGGDRRFVAEGTPNAYGGYYSKEDIREIVRYAADRFITIVPEIEWPGHSNEVFAAYPQLRCASSKSSSEFCLGNDSSFSFMQTILDEVMELFPSKIIHIGGDEASTDAWAACSLCRKRMEQERMTDPRQLQTYAIHRIAQYLNSHGRIMMGWDEIMDGPLPDSAMVMSWRGTKAGIRAAQEGYNVVMSPGDPLYLNHYQADPLTESNAQAGYTPLSSVYHYNPVPDTLPDSVGRFIVGSQACLWTEYIATPAQADYMYFPRLLAHAESSWGRFATENLEEEQPYKWEDFLLRANREVDWLRSRGINAYPLKETTTRMSVDSQEATITVFAGCERRPIDGLYYTVDGSNPTSSSPRYNPQTGIVVRDSASIVIAPFVADCAVGSFARCRVDYHKAIGSKVQYDCKIYPDYRAGGESALIDGYRGGSTYLDGRWQGFIRPMDVTIDLGKTKPISTVSATFMQIKSASVEMPQDVEVQISNDGRVYQSLGTQHRQTSPDETKFCLETFTFHTSTSARYIRFVAKQKPGPLYFLFTDEIVVW